MTFRKQILKRICSCLLAMSFVTVPTFITKAENDEKALQQVEFLEALGVYDNNTNIMSETEEYLTRENLAIILSGFIGIKDESKAGKNFETGFLDIAPDYWAAESIQAVADRKIMSGYSDGLFRPEEYATMEQAVKTLVVLAGHEINAYTNGGWSEGYMNIGQELGITKGISAGLKEPVTNAQFTQMMVNLLEAEILDVVFAANGNIEYQVTEKKFMNEMLDIYEKKGVMYANDTTSLLGHAATDENYIVVDGLKIKSDNSYSDFLGCSVRVYYRYNEDDNENELLWIERRENTQVITISSEDVETPIVDGYLEFDDDGNTKRIRLASLISLSVIYNGKLKTFAQYSDLAPKNGTVTLIDATGDGVYETAHVWNYLDYWVEKVYTQGDVVYVTDKRSDMPILEINMRDVELIEITDGTKPIDFSKISADSILSVAADNMDDTTKTINKTSVCYRIICSENKIDGVLKGISSDKYTIDGTSYLLSAYFDAKREGVNVGDMVCAYLNFDGKISIIEQTEGWQYGFLKKAVMIEDTESVLIKIMGTDSIFHDYTIDNKIRIDGQTHDTDTILPILSAAATYYATQTNFTAQNRNGYEQLIKYYVKNDRLLRIDTLVQDNPGKAREDELRYYAILPSGTSRQIIAYTGILDAGNKIVCYDENTYYFRIPSDMNESDNFDMFDLSNNAETTNSFTRVFFNDDSIGYVPVICEYGDGASNVVGELEIANCMLVEEMVYELNEDDEAAYILKGYDMVTGASQTIELQNEEVLGSRTIKYGDIVNWNENNSGKATALQKVFSLDNSGEVLNSTKSYTALNVGGRFNVGIAMARKGKFLKTKMLSKESDGTYREIMGNTSGVSNVLVCDSKTETITKGNMDAIMTADKFGETKASKVFVRHYDGRPKNIVIYN